LAKHKLDWFNLNLNCFILKFNRFTLKMISFKFLPHSILTITLLLSKPSTQTVLKCDSFSTIAFYDTIEYLCESSTFEISTKSNNFITEVSGTHENGQSNDDVTVLWLYDTRCTFFPQNIESFFPNLESIQIVNASLSEIHGDDLKPHIDMQFLMLTNNLLETVEKNLFEHNKRLKLIDLSNNRIKFVDVSAFDGLSELAFLYFYGNPCRDDAAQDDKNDVQRLITEICCSCK
jgi:hypothetical protein